MKIPCSNRARLKKAMLPLILCLALASLAEAGAIKEVRAKTIPRANTNGVADVVEAPIPKSVFVADPKLARDPFFPESDRFAHKEATPQTIERSAILLNGLTSPPKPTAMINGRTFEEGEAGEIKLKDGTRVAITCIQIGLDYAIIEVGGQKRELRLRGGL